jgi:chromosome segregation ATPase
MKKIALIWTCVAMLAMPSCKLGGESAEELARKTELTDSLNTAIAERDSLLSLLNDISTGMAEIKEVEKLMSTNLDKETPSRKAELKNDMILLKQAMQDRREKLEALEAKLRKSANYNAEMKKTIESLRSQIETQEATIAQLQEELFKANVKIDNLNVRVDSLNEVNETVNQEKQAALDEAAELTNKLNTCYYVVGSKKELKENKIISTGFLKKTKILEGDFERTYFTKADKRKLNVVKLFSKKAKVLSKHPEGSYSIVDRGETKELVINDATSFWELTNFLIVQID